MRRVMLTIAVLGVSTLTGAAQQPSPSLTFDVASIRQNTSGETGGGGRRRPDGRYEFTNVTIRSIIAMTYGVPSGRIFGGPAWIVGDRYDLSAIPRPNSTEAEGTEMLKALLRDRFGLVARVEERNFPVYFLVLLRPDGPTGPGIRRAQVDCENPEARKKALASMPPGGLGCGFRDNEGTLQAGGMTMSTLASFLAASAGRPVLDKTGLAGGFDLELKWRSSPEAGGGDGVGIFTALQEQLGLRLVSDEAPLQALVIEKIQRPTEN